jgi:hypothetical protein
VLERETEERPYRVVLVSPEIISGVTRLWGLMLESSQWENSAYPRHKISLIETDPYANLPSLSGTFAVLFEECGEESSYEPDEVLRLELELPGSFKPHPLFQIG